MCVLGCVYSWVDGRVDVCVDGLVDICMEE